MVFQLLYVSRAAHPMSEGGLGDLLVEAREYNAANDITGLLLFGGEHFYQILEGDENDVRALFGRIELDRRHVDVTLISTREIPDRSFPRWWMGFKALPNTDITSQPAFHQIRGARDLEQLPGGDDTFFGVMSAMFGSNR